MFPPSFSQGFIEAIAQARGEFPQADSMAADLGPDDAAYGESIAAALPQMTLIGPALGDELLRMVYGS